MLRTSLGEAENFYPEILGAVPDIGPVVVILYQVLGIVLLLNVLIAIFLEVRSRSGRERERELCSVVLPWPACPDE